VRRRDRKGLYARARAGEIPDFTGISSPYEAPTDARVVVDTTGRSIPDALGDVLDALGSDGWLATTAERLATEQTSGHHAKAVRRLELRALSRQRRYGNQMRHLTSRADRGTRERLGSTAAYVWRRRPQEPAARLSASQPMRTHNTEFMAAASIRRHCVGFWPKYGRHAMERKGHTVRFCCLQPP
jgi:hypothetical protein